VFQWHAILAPYTGVAMTFVLATFAGLLYWSTFGWTTIQVSETTAAPQWTANMAAAPASSPSPWSGPAARFDTPESPLSRTPMVRLNIEPLSELAAATESNGELAATPLAEEEPAERSLSKEAKLIEEAAAPATESALDVPKLTAEIEGSAPAADGDAAAAPAPLTINYPTTPFASFDLGSGVQAPGDPVEAPASAISR
jgi:hypothetical protein